MDTLLGIGPLDREAVVLNEIFLFGLEEGIGKRQQDARRVIVIT